MENTLTIQKNNLQEPLVSVIVPIYNGEKTVRKAVDCLLAQDYGNTEIIFVNDGSTDATADILSEYGDRIRVVDKPNGGVSSARNVGLENAAGKYVLFVDADDFCEKQEVSKAVAAAENLNADLVVFGFLRVKDGRTIGVHRFDEAIYEGADVVRNIGEVMTRGLGSPCNKLFVKNILDDNGIGFDETLALGEDMNFFVRCLFKCERIAFISDTPYRYDVGNSVATKKYRGDMYELRMAALENLDKVFKENDMEYPFYAQSRLKLVYASIFNLQKKQCPLTQRQKKDAVKGYLQDYRKCSLSGFNGKNKILDLILRKFPYGAVYVLAMAINKIVGGISAEKRGVSV